MKVKNIIALLCITLLLSCTTIQRNYQKSSFRISSVNNVLVFPFENLSSHPFAGEIVTSNFITELRLLNKVDIIDANLLPDKIKYQFIDTIFAGNGVPKDLDSQLKIAVDCKANTVLRGKVTEYKYKKGLGEEAVFGLNIELINVYSRDVVWQSSISLAGSVMGIGGDSVNKYSLKGIKKIIERLE